MSFRPNLSLLARMAAFGVAGFGLGACQDTSNMSSARAWKPIPGETIALMQAKGTDSHQPIVIRTYKKEAELEIWKMKSDGQYALLKTYPMCRWSGQLGPKVREGDRQVPEGFYAISPGQMNPNSNYYLSFNVGYPNAYDRALGHSGGSIMVHGACSSAGCFSMTDNQIGEIYAIAREAFGGGQRSIQMQSLPFRMTAENLAKHRLDPNMPFWRQLKQGSDHFEVTKHEPTVGVCGKRYVFDANPANGGRLDPAGACPPLTEDPQIKSLVAEKESRDAAHVAELVAKGVKPVRVMYADGGQHPDFASKIDEVSRPDALAAGPVEIAMDDGKGKKGAPAKVAAAKPEARPALAEPVQQTVATRAEEAPPKQTVATAMAPAAASAGDSIGRWLGLNKDEPKIEGKSEAKGDVKADTVSSTVKPPETILVTDPDKQAKPRRAGTPPKPQAALESGKFMAYAPTR